MYSHIPKKNTAINIKGCLNEVYHYLDKTIDVLDGMVVLQSEIDDLYLVRDWVEIIEAKIEVHNNN